MYGTIMGYSALFEASPHSRSIKIPWNGLWFETPTMNGVDAAPCSSMVTFSWLLDRNAPLQSHSKSAFCGMVIMDCSLAPIGIDASITSVRGTFVTCEASLCDALD